MPFARSYFNATLYKKYLTRFWPIWALYAIIWFFILPVNLVLNGSMGDYGTYAAAARFANEEVLRMLPEFGLGMGVLFGLLCAMAIWSYLYNNRSAGFMHALPIRREGLFFTGFLAGATFFIVPNAVVFLITLGVEAKAGAVNLSVLALWFAVQSMYCLFFFCFATICGFVTGHILALPAFYFIFNFLSIGIYSLVENVLRNFVYGFHAITGALPVANKLSPLYNISKVIRVSTERVNGVTTNVTLRGVPTLVTYTVVGLVLAALALLLYRRHQAEQAGEVVTAAWLRPVFKYGVAFCGALAFGSLLYEIFIEALWGSAWGMLGFLLLCGFLSYLVAEMLLQKSFRVLKKSWKGCAVFLAVLVVLTVAMELDLTGYEKRVPNAAEVESVTLNDVNSMPYDSGRSSDINASDSALIARMISLHTSAVRGKAAAERARLDYYHAGSTDAARDEGYFDTLRVTNFNLTYTLKNGQTMSRFYRIPVTAELLGDPASPAAMLLDILNHRANPAADYFPDTVTAADFIDGSVSFFNISGSEEYREVRLTAAEAGVIYRAAAEDLKTGGLGRRYLLRDMDYLTQVYQNEVTLVFYGTFPGWTDGEKPDSASVRFQLQADSVNLIAALRELGIVDTSQRLVTQLEYIKAEKYRNQQK